MAWRNSRFLAPLFLATAAGGFEPLYAQTCEGSNGNSAQGAGVGDFKLDLARWQPPVGARLRGVVDPGLSQAATEFFAELGTDGALHRSNVRMDIAANRDRRAADVVYVAHQYGFQAHLTCVGTPRGNATGDPPSEEWHTLPGYARTPPADMQAWADDLVAMLTEMQARWGQVPEQIEIWNEPDREEWWAGTRAEFLELYRVASTTVKAAFPQVRVGGSGFSMADAADQAHADTWPEALIRHAAATGCPLDFVSWHHYGPASELRYTGTVDCLRRLAADLALAPPQLIVSEWNLYPSGGALNPYALELDGAPAAAQAACFLSSAAHLQIDGNCFFMVQDVEDGGSFEVHDLTGAGTGGFTRRGIKKPVYRLFELLYPMALEYRPTIGYPSNEWAATVFAARLPEGGVRLVIGNDVVEPSWVWNNGCLERGADPRHLYEAVLLLGSMGLQVSYNNLVQVAGLEPWEAIACLEVRTLATEAQWLAEHPRTLRIRVQNGWLIPHTAWRFDSARNAPVQHREALLPALYAVEAAAEAAALAAAIAFFEGIGVDVPDKWEIEDWPSSPEELALLLDVPLYVAVEGWDVFYSTLETERLAERESLNARPETQLHAELPEAAGVNNATPFLEVTLEPNAVTVLDCYWLSI